MTRCTHLSIVLSHFQIVLPWVDHESSSFLLYCGHPHAGLCLVSLNSSAQKIFSVDYESRADIKVFVVDYESRADLLVYREDYESRATGNEGRWFFVDYESRADKSVFFVDYESRADLKIYFVDYESRAGWRNKSKQHLLY